MLEENPFAPRAVSCLVHRKERATHICTEFGCQQVPLLCAVCLSDPRWRAQHPHEGSVRGLGEGVEWLAGVVRGQSKSIELVYERTIGSRECELMRFNLEKGAQLGAEMEDRMENLRLQLELEMELLVKEFQKQVQQEKVEFGRRLEEYRRLFSSNMEHVKRECLELLAFQNSLKYYNNANNFTLKLLNESERRSSDWLNAQKRILLRVAQILDSPAFANNLMYTLTRATKANALALPSWKGDKRDAEAERDMRAVIRNALGSWVDLPEVAELEQNRQGEYTASNKFISYPIAV